MTATAPSAVSTASDLSHLRLRLSGRDAGERQRRRAHRGPAEQPGRSPPRGNRQGGSGLRCRPEPPVSGWVGFRPRGRAGSLRTSPPSSPASASPGWRWTPSRVAARSRCGDTCATSPTAPTARRRSACGNGRSPGPTGSSSARSGSIPTGPAPPSSSSPSIASTMAAFAATVCRWTRSPSRSSRPGWRCAPSTPSRSRAVSASATPRPGSRWRGSRSSWRRGR